MIELKDYWAQHRDGNELSLTPEIEEDAERTVKLANQLLVEASLAGVNLHLNPATGTHVSSGWRPPSVNANTQGAAPNSKHMTGQAIDIYDPDGDLDNWLITDSGLKALEDLGLWIEHPLATKGWSHLQIIPPGSRHRVYFP